MGKCLLGYLFSVQKDRGGVWAVMVRDGILRGVWLDRRVELCYKQMRAKRATQISFLWECMVCICDHAGLLLGAAGLKEFLTLVILRPYVLLL
jgi:hypothetical protein